MNSIIISVGRLASLFILLVNFTIHSQGNYADTNWPEPIFEHFTLADGLPENTVLSIFQDHLGYL
ncbi:MAG: hypothetical protein IPM14_07215 [bacterium]|nr:hypothetical protein [bacterium]